ncbi:PP2C family protein-serine/threonine phosphatase [Actinacidiphila glaucinigra]|uniref:PP2C family protein-serine/threonine phosphatase n=1 Tax=Actinacidiphila glaucinigra TaxID=235986 RepID=UPI0035E27929
MDVARRLGQWGRSWRPGHLLVAAMIMLILVVTAVDIMAPPDVHLGPFLVAAPAITASFAGARTTAIVGGVAVAAQILVAGVRTTPLDLNHSAQIATLALMSVLATFFAHLRVKHQRQVTRLRSVAETAQRVLLRPIPRRIGPLCVASVYLAAEAEAQIGGDLYAAVRTDGGTRVIVGDVRGKGMEAVNEAALTLGAFRAVAHRQAELPALVLWLERALSSELTDPAAEAGRAEDEAESFVTAVVADIPDDKPVVHLVTCGHPPPLVLHDGRVTSLDMPAPAPPLGLTQFVGGAGEEPTVRTFPFGPGDTLLLYTDGVVEARDASGAFYPLTGRLAGQPAGDPEALVDRLCADLLAHVGGCLDDDAAVLAISRPPALVPAAGRAGGGPPAAPPPPSGRAAPPS